MATNEELSTTRQVKLDDLNNQWKDSKDFLLTELSESESWVFAYS